MSRRRRTRQGKAKRGEARQGRFVLGHFHFDASQMLQEALDTLGVVAERSGMLCDTLGTLGDVLGQSPSGTHRRFVMLWDTLGISIIRIPGNPARVARVSGIVGVEAKQGEARQGKARRGQARQIRSGTVPW